MPIQDLLADVAARVPKPGGPDCVLVAVDGVDGAGKTTFADGLARALEGHVPHTVRISLDDFHHPREIRHRRGKDSPEGFWLDSYDYEQFADDVLGPLSPGGNRRYRPRAHDLDTDEPLTPDPVEAPPGSVVVIDGLFLHRDELATRWTYSIFLDVPFAETARRMALRDGSNPDPEHESMQRYVGGQRIYLAACSPTERADIVIDNSDPTEPRIVQRA